MQHHTLEYINMYTVVLAVLKVFRKIIPEFCRALKYDLLYSTFWFVKLTPPYTELR